jgi:hypothetical protein
MKTTRALWVMLLLAGIAAAAACSPANTYSEPTDEDDTSIRTGGTGGGGNGGQGAETSTGGKIRPDAPPGCEGTITFTDPVLDAAVRRVLSEDVGDITHDDIWLFDTLELEGGVASLEGVECLTGLDFIKIQHAQISDLSPLAQLELLTFLGLSYNEITNLEPLRSLDTLTKLYVEGNPISDLGPIASLTALTHLSAGNSQVSDLSPLENLTELEWLSMYNAEVTDLTPLVNNPGIGAEGDEDTVNLNGNPIDCDEQAANIQELEDRGVNLSGLCP